MGPGGGLFARHIDPTLDQAVPSCCNCSDSTANVVSFVTQEGLKPHAVMHCQRHRCFRPAPAGCLAAALHNATPAWPRQRRITRPVLICWAVGGDIGTTYAPGCALHTEAWSAGLVGGSAAAGHTAALNRCMAHAGRHRAAPRLQRTADGGACQRAEAAAFTCQWVPCAQHPVGMDHALHGCNGLARW